MKKILIYCAVLFLFPACSFKAPPNEWQYNSVSAFDSYQKNFLSANDSLGKNDLNRAIKYAKSSDDLTTLSAIYLGECALNISVGIKDECKKYSKISLLVNDSSLSSYYAFMRLQIGDKEIELLPKNYKPFSLHLKNLEYKKANDELLVISEPTSMFLCGALLGEHIEDRSIDKIINIASFHGYKKVTLFWLNIKKERTIDPNEKSKIAQKISILSL